ncbi:MAG: KH domain-containing protein [Bifidobacteriaceae bacterium]|jgi:predicted RNA-binding protein YlqC (UPF0109 family)|nr:KH domain-containing protein [Bifidobacteriaceae bacterium]
MLEDALTAITKSLVNTPDDVAITCREFGKLKIYTIAVNPDEYGQLIGRNGKVIKALRVLGASLSDNPSTVRINLAKTDDHKDEISE